jgi:alpha-ribazole phosphatase/probable phosphoglycerate mutase
MNDAHSTTLDLIRHGEPVGGSRYRGRTDDPLSEKGWQQMRAATARPDAWQAIVSSPLSRCHAFALELGGRLGLAVRVDERLQEVGFGAWEGRTGEQIRQDDPEALHRFYHDPVGARPAGAEPLEAFQGRVSAALEALVEDFQGRHILLVTHAGVVRAAIAHALSAPLGAIYRMHVDNAAITRLRRTGERPLSLIFHGRRTT